MTPIARQLKALRERAYMKAAELKVAGYPLPMYADILSGVPDFRETTRRALMREVENNGHQG